MEINPSHYGLPTRIHLEKLGENRLGIHKVIKSRLIQKDAVKIIDIATKIKSEHPDLELTLICKRNICSKSVALLDSVGIGLKYV